MYKLTSMNKYPDFIKAMKGNKWVLVVSCVCVVVAIILLINVVHIGGQLADSVKF